MKNLSCFTKPSRKVSRAADVVVEMEEIPLLNSNRSEAIQPSKTVLLPSKLDSMERSVRNFSENLHLRRHYENFHFMTSMVPFYFIHTKDRAENIADVFRNYEQQLKNTAILWSAFQNRSDLLELFLPIVAELNSYEQDRFSALHFAAFGNSVEAAQILLNNGALISTPSYEQSALHCAVYANSLDCVKLFIEKDADVVNSLEQKGINAIHLAAYLGYAECLKVLLNAPAAKPNIRISTSVENSTALHLAADEGNFKCVNLLLDKEADSNLKNDWEFTALHLAARKSSFECVESLLDSGHADPNAEAINLWTPLHMAVVNSEHAINILQSLISRGADINRQDIDGFSALHHAAYHGLPKCVEKLISLGADLTIKSKTGITALTFITKYVPAAVAIITHKFDAAITINRSQDVEDRDFQLNLNFLELLQYSHPHEISYLNTVVDEGHNAILEHPLCSAFLYIKWEKIRKFYYGRWIFCFVFVLFLTLYILAAVTQNCYNDSNADNTTAQAQVLCQKQSILGDMLRNNPFVTETLWWVLVCVTIFEIFRKFCGMTEYSSIGHYLTQKENYLEWFVIVSVVAICGIHTKQTYTFQYPIGAFAVLVGWTNLMLMVGQSPVFDVYVAMYTKVLKEFGKLFAAYLCMLVGFAVSFCVLFPLSPSFADPFMGFITVLDMMAGEQHLSLLTNNSDGKDPSILLELSRKITFVLFLVFVTIILMNLLVGIAVHDIQGLKKTAEQSKLVQQTKLIYYVESILFEDKNSTWLNKILHYIRLKFLQACEKELCVKPLNPGEKKLPRDILMAAYEVAKKHETISSRCSDDQPNNNNSQESVRLSRANAKSIEALTKEMREFKNIVIHQLHIRSQLH